MRRATLAALASLATISLASAQTLIKPTERKESPPEFHVKLTTPLHLLYLEQTAVRAELKFSNDQLQKIDALQKGWVDLSREIDLEKGSEMDPVALANGTRKMIESILTVAQMKRLEQIILRHREKEHGLPAVLTTVARDLKLSGEQQERFETLRRNRADAVLEYLTSDERANAIHRSVHEANQKFIEAVNQLLTKEQQARLQEMLGEPFAAEFRLRSPLSVGVEAPPRRSVYLDQLLGKYGLEAEILRNDSVHKELKLSDDEIRKAKEFNVAWWARYEQLREQGATELDAVLQQHDFVKDQLLKILSQEQLIRFHQIATQYRHKIGGEAAALGHPSVLGRRTLAINGLIVRGEFITEALIEQALAKLPSTIGAQFQGELKINSALKVTQSAQVHRAVAVVPLVETNRVTLARFMLENARRYRLDEEQVARLKAIDEDLPKLRKLLHRELSQLPPSTDGGAARTMIPETKAVEHFRKAVFDQCFELLDKKQQSLFGAELRAARASIIDY
jgi:hypothetical protein